MRKFTKAAGIFDFSAVGDVREIIHMNMNNTPVGERVHIGIFGRRNAGKSSLLNALTGQELAVVSPVKGTTTDPVQKAMELLPLGPVVFIDTPGLDDEGELGKQRMEKSRRVIRRCDIALLVIGADEDSMVQDRELLREFQERGIPFLVLLNKADLLCAENTEEWTVEPRRQQLAGQLGVSADLLLCVSARTGQGIRELKEALPGRLPQQKERSLIRDLLSPGDVVVLVVPIDESAPKGRLILPQQQVIRDLLEGEAVSVVTRETMLEQTLASLGRAPRLVVTDSQVFERVAKMVPQDTPLTSFSILMSRYKGDLAVQIAGAKAVEDLQDGDRVLICEGCTHHRQCEDIGTVKMPRWISEYTKKELQFSFSSGGEFPKDLTPYALVVHCGGCMLNAREMADRIAEGEARGVPITNYGVIIAYMHGILDRVTASVLY